jgi:uncharacterized coiled-coil protein SlyX
MPHPPTADQPSVRRRLADARATIVGTKGLRSRVARQSSALATMRERLDGQQQRVARQDERLKDLEARVKDLGRATTLDTVERERRDAQFGTLEVRVADLEQRLADARPASTGTPLDDEQLAEGQSLLEEVRTEHDRIRVRMQIVSAYEERLRRVEESVAALYDGDRRHPV